MVNDIVVESGSARYQDVIDRFVHGDNVTGEVLAHVWRDTTQPEIWDLPIYEELFRAVRDVNASLPRERQLRVLLGDPPAEWENVHTLRDLDQWGSRDHHAADVVQRDVLARKRHALLIYGDDHLAKKTRALGASDDRPTNVVRLLEQGGAPVFVVHTETRMPLDAIQADVRSWPNPSVATLARTVLGVRITSRVPASSRGALKNYSTQCSILDRRPASRSRELMRRCALMLPTCRCESHVCRYFRARRHRLRRARSLRSNGSSRTAPIAPADRIEFRVPQT